jgi:hypothetical protein
MRDESGVNEVPSWWQLPWEPKVANRASVTLEEVMVDGGRRWARDYLEEIAAARVLMP